MRYRIKIETYTDGRVEYYAQVKCLWWWEYLTSYGGFQPRRFVDSQKSREQALKRIDHDYSNRKRKRAKIKSIEFEYVNRESENVY